MPTTREEAVAAAAEALTKAAHEIAQGARPPAEADDLFMRARLRIEADVSREHGADGRAIVNDALAQVREAAQPTETCHCGRPVRLLNAVSYDAKCVGCGYVPDLCRCTVLGGADDPWYKTHPLIGGPHP